MYHLSKGPEENDHILGNPSAPVVLVEYGDYECPISTRSWPWIKLLLNEFGNDICYVFRHFPLNIIHPHSALAAASAEAADIFESFWQMHELLYSRDDTLSFDNILDMANSLDLDEKEFVYVINREDLIDKVSSDIMSGEESGVNNTPAFFINSVRLEGPVSFEILRENIMKIMGGQRISA
jgi:protein-disulfide isomerase